MDFRLVTEEDDKAVRRLWSYSFNGDEPFFSWYFSQFYDRRNGLGGYENGELLTCLHLHPYQLSLRGSSLATSYIVGVASDPAARRGGMIRHLLTASLEEMRRRGHWISILMPSKAGFYAPYQWLLCYHHLLYVVKLEDLRPLAKPAGNILYIESVTLDFFAQSYAKFVAGKHGYVERTQQDWVHRLNEHINDKGFVYCLEMDGQPAGYIMYSFKGKTMLIKDMVYADARAQAALFSFIYGHRSQAEYIDWNAPVDDLSYLALFDPKQDIRMYPFMTARLVDVAQALEAARYPAELEDSLTIRVRDDMAPWNHHCFRLTVSGGQGRVEITDQTPAQLECQVGPLTQLFFGRLSASQLWRQGALTGQPGAAARMDALFPPCVTYINEYF